MTPFLAFLRYNGDLDLALLNVEDRIGGLPLAEDRLLALVFCVGFSGPNGCKEGLGIDLLKFLTCHRLSSTSQASRPYYTMGSTKWVRLVKQENQGVGQ